MPTKLRLKWSELFDSWRVSRNTQYGRSKHTDIISPNAVIHCTYSPIAILEEGFYVRQEAVSSTCNQTGYCMYTQIIKLALPRLCFDFVKDDRHRHGMEVC